MAMIMDFVGMVVCLIDRQMNLLYRDLDSKTTTRD